MKLGDVAVWNLTAPRRIKINQGGWWSGKTWGILQAIALKSALHDESPKLTSVVAATFPHLRRGALKQFEEMIGLEPELIGNVTINRTDHIFTFSSTGSQVEFFSADNEGKMRGAKRHRLFINEANLISHNSYFQLAGRTSEDIYLDFNPVSEFWVHEKVQPRDDAAFCISTYKNNPALPPNVLRETELLRTTDPALYRIYGEGLVGQIKGLIFPNVREVREFPVDARKVAFGLDFGFTNDPTALVKIGELHGELFGEELLFETGMTTADIHDALGRFELRKTDVIIADSAEPRLIEELRRKGWNIRPCKKGPDSVRHGINLLKKYAVINLTVGSANWRKEAAYYKWKELDGKPLNEPIDMFNHCWDAARYAAQQLAQPAFTISY